MKLDAAVSKTKCRGITIYCAVLFVVMAVSCGSASGFSLLDFPSDAEVQVGGYKVWALDQENPPQLTQSYAIASDLDSQLASGAFQAASDAVASWNNVASAVNFADAGYEPVESGNSTLYTARKWEGALDDFGMGGNIDIMARPMDFTLSDFRGKTHGFGAQTLAFTVINALSGSIQSVDIYLNSEINLINSNYQWTSSGGNFDVETVVLHELGHALGLDHPDQVSDHPGSANYDPYTSEPGYGGTGGEVMRSTYFPNGVNRILSTDEIGGLHFLYPVSFLLEGDVDFDNDVDINDLIALAGTYGQTSDINDLLALAENYGVGVGDPLATPAPEPATLSLLAIGGVALLRRRR